MSIKERAIDWKKCNIMPTEYELILYFTDFNSLIKNSSCISLISTHLLGTDFMIKFDTAFSNLLRILITA